VLLRVSGEARLLGPSADSDRFGRDLEEHLRRRPSTRRAGVRVARCVAGEALSFDLPPSRAYDVLAPALEGFSSTAQFPKLAEAQNASRPARLATFRRKIERPSA
jgi:hypothetical protein